MITPAQFVLNAAVRHIADRYDGFAVSSSWDDGEAESWLQKIASGKYELSIRIDDCVIIPCLVAA